MPVDQPTDHHPPGQIPYKQAQDQGVEGTTPVPEAEVSENDIENEIEDDIEHGIQDEIVVNPEHLIPHVRQGRRNPHFLLDEFNNDENPEIWDITSQIVDDPEFHDGEFDELVAAAAQKIKQALAPLRNQVSLSVPKTYDNGFEASVNAGVLAAKGSQPLASCARDEVAVPSAFHRIIVYLGTHRYPHGANNQVPNQAEEPAEQQVSPIGAEIRAQNNGEEPVFLLDYFVDALIGRLPVYDMQGLLPSPHMGHEPFAEGLGLLPSARFSTPGPRRDGKADQYSGFADPAIEPTLRFATPGPRRDGQPEEAHPFNHGLAGQVHQQVWAMPTAPRGPHADWCHIHGRYCIVRPPSTFGSPEYVSPRVSSYSSSGAESGSHLGLDDLRRMIAAFPPNQLQEAGIHLFDPAMIDHHNRENFNNTQDAARAGYQEFRKQFDWKCPRCGYDCFGRNALCKECLAPPPPGFGAAALRAAQNRGEHLEMIQRAVQQAEQVHYSQQGAHLGTAAYGQANAIAGPSGYNGGTNFAPRFANGLGYQYHNGIGTGYNGYLQPNPNDHINGNNGHTNGHTHGQVNGYTHGQTNGHTNGNGQANANAHANANTNGDSHHSIPCGPRCPCNRARAQRH